MFNIKAAIHLSAIALITLGANAIALPANAQSRTADSFNFDEITAESPTIFSTPAQPVFGLYDAHGNELIPAEFQQLSFLRNDIIQGRKDGDIFYFNREGKPITLD